MKELQFLDKISEKQGVELEQQQKKKQEFKYDSSLKPMRGHRVWELNLSNDEIIEASFMEQKTVLFESANEVVNKEIVRKPNCVYISALNPKSARSRYSKGKGSACLPFSNMKL
jgi:hypothetical protein